jgi:hypothetical protein
MKIPSDSSIASRLLRAVIAKSFIEIALVCAVATLAAFSTFSPQLRGAIDVADRTRIAGWVHDPLSPDEMLEVQLFIDGQLASSGRAGDRRDDLVEAGVTAGPNHGFSFEVSTLRLSPGIHTAQVYALRQAAGATKMLLPISKQPVAFEIDP